MSAEALSPDNGRVGRRLILWLPIAYVLISAAVLVALLVQLRQQAIDSGRELVQSFARLANEQTSRTIQTSATTAQIIEARLNAPGRIPEPAFSNRLRESVGVRPFMRSIWVLDADGQMAHGTGDAVADHSDRSYFRHFQANPQAAFEVFPPVRSRVTHEWLIPVAKAWLRADGSFAGVIVVALDPRYFDRAWTLDIPDQDLIVALLRRDGIMLTRSPHTDDVMGRSFADGPLFKIHLPARSTGVYRLRSSVDGRERLLAYHALGEYPDLLIVAGQTVDHVLAGWRRTVLVVVIGWLAASAALGAMAFWLMREWTRRQQTERRYRLLFDANPHPMAVHDPRTLRFLAVNDAAIRQYGWSREEFLGGMTLADIRPPEELPNLRDAARSGQPVHRMRHWRKDGTRFEVEAVVTPITLDDRPATLALAQDVTERNLSRSRLLDAIQAFPGSFRLYDRDERLVMSNDVRWGSGQIELPAPKLGKSFEEAARFSADNELDMAAVGRKEEWLAGRLAQFRRGDTDAEIQWRDGRWFQLLERRTSDGGTISLRFDITARKAVEEQLRQAQKMDAIGQLTGGVAHDLNNMLTVIIGNAEALLDGSALEAEARETMELMLRAAEGSAELTNRLLAFARRQPLRPKRVDVNEFVGRMEALLRRSLGEQVEIALARSPDLWPVSIDPAQLESAVVNLAINARDAMPEGGRLTISTGNVIVDATYAATHHDFEIGDYVVVAITDTGAGMSPDVIARVFEPFFTTKDVGKGTGLGLSMVYGFVQQSGGHVTIYSEVGQGTTVRMYLPRAIDDQPDAAISADQAPIATARGETILLVEDDDIVRGHVAAQLAQLGYRVIQSPDGHHALGVLAGDASIDLLFTDMVMPGGIGGRELAEQARRLRPDIRTLFTTGYSADAVVRAGRLEFEAPLLSKPYRLRELAERVREALARG